MCAHGVVTERHCTMCLAERLERERRELERLRWERHWVQQGWIDRAMEDLPLPPHPETT